MRPREGGLAKILGSALLQPARSVCVSLSTFLKASFTQQYTRVFVYTCPMPVHIHILPTLDSKPPIVWSQSQALELEESMLLDLPIVHITPPSLLVDLSVVICTKFHCVFHFNHRYAQ